MNTDGPSPGSRADADGTGGEAKAGTAPQRGRPRSEQADRAIMAAALELLAERGIAGMSIEEVASRAGVGKATVYRRWSSKGALALDAFLAEFRGQQPLPDTGSLRGDLHASLRAWVHAVTETPVAPNRSREACWRIRLTPQVASNVSSGRAVNRLISAISRMPPKSSARSRLMCVSFTLPNI